MKSIFKKISPVDLYVDELIMEDIFQAISNLRNLSNKLPKDYESLHTSTALILARRTNPPSFPTIHIPARYLDLTLKQLHKRFDNTLKQIAKLEKKITVEKAAYYERQAKEIIAKGTYGDDEAKQRLIIG